MNDSSSQLADSLMDFVHEYVHSVEQLEVLLLLESESTRGWRAEELADALHVNIGWVEPALADLVAHGLVEGGAGYFRYGPVQSELHGSVAELRKAYETRRGELLVFISKVAISRIRGEAIRTFADALRSSKRDDDT